MNQLKNLLDNNQRWAEQVKAREPDFFEQLVHQQSPEYLWIGCSDSRVPANEIVGLKPGELFVHRNVANVVVHTDFNCLSVIEYAVEVLKVKHIILCGHYGCGGVQAALTHHSLGLIDNWLRHVKDVMKRHEKDLDAITDQKQRLNRLCELNVMEQVQNISNTTIIQKALRRDQEIDVHGWIYDIGDGLIRDLEVSVTN